MASKKKDEREVVRWVTVKGKHMPIYADGSIGVGREVNDKGTMSPNKLSETERRRDELWDKEDHGKLTDKEKKELKQLEDDIENHYSQKKSSNSFTRTQQGMSNLQNAKENVDMLKEQLKKHPNDMHTAEIKSRLKKAETEYKTLSKGQSVQDKNFKTAKEWDKEAKKSPTSKNAKYDTSRASKSTLSAKQQKAVEMAKSSLLFDKGYAEISSNNFSYAKISNADMAKYLSAIDSKYDYEYRQEKTKGLFMMPNAEVTHHRIYRKPKKK